MENMWPLCLDSSSTLSKPVTCGHDNERKDVPTECSDSRRYRQIENYGTVNLIILTYCISNGQIRRFCSTLQHMLSECDINIL